MLATVKTRGGEAALGKEMALTASNIRYLLTIRQLDCENQGVRCIDIANALRLTKPTVHSMIRKLIELGLVSQDHGGAVYLTEQGCACAHQYGACHSTAVRMFRGLLDLSEREAKGAAYSLLAEIPPARLSEVRDRMDAAVRVG